MPAKQTSKKVASEAAALSKRTRKAIAALCKGHKMMAYALADLLAVQDEIASVAMSALSQSEPTKERAP